MISTLIAIFLFFNCTKKKNSSNSENLNSPTSDPGANHSTDASAPVFLLKSSSWLTSLENVPVEIRCNSWSDFSITTTADAQTPTDWQNCGADKLDHSVSLSPGDNFLRIWFRKDNENVSYDLGFRHLADSYVVNDPNPNALAYFGGDFQFNNDGTGGVLALKNGNIVVFNPSDSSSLSKQGAVHLFNSRGTHISSIYGDQSNNQLGYYVDELKNGNFVVRTFYDDTATLNNNGSVILVNGETGKEISRIEGERSNDLLGLEFLELKNGNYVICSQFADSGGLSDSGVYILVNGVTGAEISRIAGDQANNEFCQELFLLSNGNFVIRSGEDDTALTTDSGSIVLVDGTSGLEIGRLEGDHSNDKFGYSTTLLELPNGNFLVRAFDNNTDTLTDCGAVILVSGSTGLEIGRIEGDQSDNNIGAGNILVLSNGNYILSSPLDDTATLTDNGSVIYVNGATGLEVWRKEGTQNNDRLNGRPRELANGNLLISYEKDDTGGLTDNGSVAYVNASDGVEISRINGERNGDQLKTLAIFDSGHYLIGGRYVDTASVSDAGAAILINGTTHTEISRIEGDQINDHIAYLIIPLKNGNYVLISKFDDTDSLTDCGSMILVNGTTGSEIARLYGDHSNDELTNNTIWELPNGNFFIRSSNDNSDSHANVGSVILVNGVSGEVLTKLQGTNPNEMLGNSGHTTNPDSTFAIPSQSASSNGLTSNGLIVVIDGTTGAEISRMEGSQSFSYLGGKFVNNEFANIGVVADSYKDIDGKSQAGRLLLMPLE